MDEALTEDCGNEGECLGAHRGRGGDDTVIEDNGEVDLGHGTSLTLASIAELLEGLLLPAGGPFCGEGQNRSKLTQNLLRYYKICYTVKVARTGAIK